MFLENTVNPKEQFGWIEVICGSMFSGKTEELIRRLKRAKIAQQKVEIFKPSLDQRYDASYVTSHDDNQIRSTPVPTAANIPILADGCEVIGIDEAQFFDDEIVQVCNDMANRGIRVIVAGLDMDYKGNPFGPMPALMATAEYVTKVHAVCTRTGNLAQYSFRKSAQKNLIHLGYLKVPPTTLMQVDFLLLNSYCGYLSCALVSCADYRKSNQYLNTSRSKSCEMHEHSGCFKHSRENTEMW